MRKPFIASLVVLAILSASRATGAEKFDPAARAAAVAPYLDDQAIAVGHIDLTRIDVEALFKEIVAVFAKAEMAAPDAVEIEEKMRAEGSKLAEQAEKWIEEFTRAGTSELYLVFTLADLADFPQKTFFVIAPVKEGGDHRAVAGLLYSGRPDGPTKYQDGPRRTDMDISQRIGDAVFAGSSKALARLKTLTPTPRPELTAAFKAAGDTTAQGLFIPTEDNRRVLREMLPQMPEEFGGGSGKQIADALQWAAVGIELPPRPSVGLVVQSKDAQSAETLKGLVQGGYRLLGQVKDVQKLFPKFDELTALVLPTVEGDRLRITLDRQGIHKVLLSGPLVHSREGARRAHCLNNFKQLGLAMLRYEVANKRFPAAATYDKDGKKLLSWRVQLLPHLGEVELYKQFHLDEPWDSPHNRKLIPKMPRAFACPSTAGALLAKKGMTMYLAPVGEKTVFGGKEGAAIRDITDGTSRTIMLVEADPEQAVIWTKPDDLQIDPDNPLRGLSGPHEGGFITSFCDGHTESIMIENIDPNKLRALFTRDGGEPID